MTFADIPDLGAAPSASDVILKFLRTEIVSGRLAEGKPVKQDEMAKLFNVSKIPVREALKQLEAEGFVTFRRNKGAIVASLSEPEIIEIFEVRALLEAQAIRLAVPRMSEATFQRAASYCAAFSRETDVSKWAELNWTFHSSLYLDSERPYLLRLIRTVNDRVERYLRLQLTVSGGHDNADHEHQEILRACRESRADDAAALVYDHIMGACQSLRQHVQAVGDSQFP